MPVDQHADLVLGALLVRDVRGPLRVRPRLRLRRLVLVVNVRTDHATVIVLRLVAGRVAVLGGFQAPVLGGFGGFVGLVLVQHGHLGPPALVVRPYDDHSIAPVGPPLRLRVAPVEEHLEEDEEVDGHLDGAAHPELDGGVAQQEVHGLEDVAARPHHHHRQAGIFGFLRRLEGQC